jgi:hypothetical protein
MEISRLAQYGCEKASVRADYQLNTFKLIKPIILKESDQKNDLRIIEDCLASGDTIMGVLNVFKKQEKPCRKVRIDILTATGQGLLVLKKFAEENKIKLELNVGYLAYGLSAGIKRGGVREHANYLVYPSRLKRQLKIPYVFVVGDMGDGAKSLPESYVKKCPWNKFRNDEHGQRKLKVQNLKVKTYNNSLETLVYLTNGGYLMKAFYDWFFPDNKNPEIILSANRKWLEKPYGYGVLVSMNHYRFLK